jgi:hypothetical protein
VTGDELGAGPGERTDGEEQPAPRAVKEKKHLNMWLMRSEAGKRVLK